MEDKKIIDIEVIDQFRIPNVSRRTIHAAKNLDAIVSQLIQFRDDGLNFCPASDCVSRCALPINP